MWACDWTWRQGVCPAKRIAAEGFELVWLKAGGALAGDDTNGRRERFIDPTFMASAWEVQQTNMVPGAYWFLMPGRPRAQAALLYDLLCEAQPGSKDRPEGWAVKLDVEAGGLQYADVSRFAETWNLLAGGYPLFIYTNRTAWNRILPAEQRDNPTDVSGVILTPYLEEAHWVPETVRTSQERPYASQQAKAIKPEWWDLAWGNGTTRRLGYAGWGAATMLQFTDNALIAGDRQMASLYRGTAAEFRRRFTRP